MSEAVNEPERVDDGPFVPPAPLLPGELADDAPQETTRPGDSA